MSANRIGQRRVLFLALLASAWLVSACGDGEGPAWEEGFTEGYADGHGDGARRGEARGATDGRREGRASAAGTGSRSRLRSIYLGPILWSFGIGIAIGLLVQYIVLFEARDKGRVPSLLQTGLVPGMRASFSYRLLERRWRLLAQLDDWLERVAHQRQARIQEIRSVRAVVAAKINAASDLEELVGRKYVQLASRELDRIVREAESGRPPPPSDPD